MTVLFDHNSNWGHFILYGKRMFFKEKTTIYKQGTYGDGFYYIEKGLVKVTTKTTNGNDLLINIAIPSQLIGVQAMDQQVHFSTAEAIKDSVLYFFSYQTVTELIYKNHHIRSLLLQTVIHKMHTLTPKIYLDSLSSEQQIAHILLNVYLEFKQFEIPLTQADITKCTGLTRITVYKVLKEWKEKGYIEPLKKFILIKNPSALQKYIGGYSSQVEVKNR